MNERVSETKFRQSIKLSKMSSKAVITAALITAFSGVLGSFITVAYSNSNAKDEISSLKKSLEKEKSKFSESQSELNGLKNQLMDRIEGIALIQRNTEEIKLLISSRINMDLPGIYGKTVGIYHNRKNQAKVDEIETLLTLLGAKVYPIHKETVSGPKKMEVGTIHYVDPDNKVSAESLKSILHRYGFEVTGTKKDNAGSDHDIQFKLYD